MWSNVNLAQTNIHGYAVLKVYGDAGTTKNRTQHVDSSIGNVIAASIASSHNPRWLSHVASHTRQLCKTPI
jgi:hypothetical protein